MNKRNSSIELLKIIAMFMIVLSHSVPFWDVADTAGMVDLTQASKNISNIILLFYRYIGQLGNVIFIICSAYFLQDSKNTKIKKILYIIIDAFFISMMFLVIFAICKIDLSMKEIIKQFFPITFNNNWFIGCYIIFYIIHPLLNYILEKVNQKQLLHINMFIVIWYFCIQFVVSPSYNNIIGFVCIYFIVAYLKKYLKNFSSNIKLNLIYLAGSFILFCAFILAWNFVGCKVSMTQGKMLRFATIINPFIIFIAIPVFNIFNNRTFQNEIINYISSITLLIYLVHDNILLREYIKSSYWAKIAQVFSYKYIPLITIITAIIVFVLSLIVSTIYKKTIQKVLKRICNKISSFLEKLENKITSIFININ